MGTVDKVKCPGGRSTNLELFRIISMLVIVAHHYVVNSGLIDMVYESTCLGLRDTFLLLFGWGGKTGVNCFILITGYFMCTSEITMKKYIKLLGERYFYCIIIFLIFLVSGYDNFSLKGMLKVIFPFFTVKDGFVSCFLLFYPLIPFINKLIQVMTKREHFCLMTFLLFIYTVLPSFAKATVEFNYVTWFIVLYILAAYLRLHLHRWADNVKIWTVFTMFFLTLSWFSVVFMAGIGDRFGRREWAYFFVADCNKILAVCTAVVSFMLFKNLKMRQNRFINMAASSTFGVLLIHANSDIMRRWLWKDTLKNRLFYNSPYLASHAVASVLIVFCTCVVMDQIRIRMIERPVLNAMLKKVCKTKVD